MGAVDLTASSARWDAKAKLIAIASVLLLLGGFAIEGPQAPMGMAAAGIVLVVVLAVLPRPPWETVLPLLGLLLLTPQLSGSHLFDPVPIVLAAAAFILTLGTRDRRVWDIRGPGALMLIFLGAPLLALPWVTSHRSFLGAYKNFILYAMLFVGLRRLVPQARSSSLLWIFPITGTAIALQLLLKVKGVGGNLLTRVTFRHFYTDLGWGSSNFVAAVLLLCLCGTFILWMVQRGWWLRLAFIGAMALMLHAFMILFSRGAALALVAFLIVLVIGWGGRRSLMAAGFASLLLVFGITSPAGQVLAARFTEPGEWASWTARIELWTYAWHRFLSDPWTGIGLNQGRYLRDPMGDYPPHNTFLYFLMEQGILGALFFFAFVVAVYRLCWRARSTVSPRQHRTLRIALVATWTAILVNSMVEPTLSAYVFDVLFLFLLSWLTLQDPSPQGGVGEVESHPAARDAEQQGGGQRHNLGTPLPAE